MRRKKPDPAELCSNPESAERFAEAARQAFREAHPPSRVDRIMAEAFRKAALAKERAVGGGEIEADDMPPSSGASRWLAHAVLKRILLLSEAQ